MEESGAGTETFEDLIRKLKDEFPHRHGHIQSEMEKRILSTLELLPHKIENYVVQAINETNRKWKQDIYDARQRDRELLGSIKAILYKDGWKPPTQVAELLALMQARLSLDP